MMTSHRIDSVRPASTNYLPWPSSPSDLLSAAAYRGIE